jgi:hypothetical protein
MQKCEATRYIYKPLNCDCNVKIKYNTCMDVLPLCGLSMMVANTYEIKPLDLIHG